jgi:hypothetical protein
MDRIRAKRTEYVTGGTLERPARKDDQEPPQTQILVAHVRCKGGLITLDRVWVQMDRVGHAPHGPCRVHMDRVGSTWTV